MTTDAPTSSDIPADGEMSLLEHLDELRRRLVRASAALVVGAAVAYALFPEVLDVLLRPYCALDGVTLEAISGADGSTCRLIATRPLEAFSTRVKTSLVLGLMLGGPIIFLQLWRFVAPGLTSRERRYAWPFVVGSQLMFTLGIAFAWFVLPNALRVLGELGGDGIGLLLSASEYVSFVLTTSIAFGIVFLLPLVLVFLALLGVVTARALATARPYAVVGTAVLSALITPTTDPVTMLAMMAPMVVFYEVAIVVSRVIEWRRRRTERTSANA